MDASNTVHRDGDVATAARSDNDMALVLEAQKALNGIVPQRRLLALGLRDFEEEMTRSKGHVQHILQEYADGLQALQDPHGGSVFPMETSGYSFRNVDVLKDTLIDLFAVEFQGRVFSFFVTSGLNGRPMLCVRRS
jgi:hypothetical protein